MRLVPTNDEEREVIRHVKAVAAVRGETMTDFVMALLRKAVDTEGETR